MPSIFVIMESIGKGEEFIHMFLATSELLFSVSVAFTNIRALLYIIKKHKEKDTLRLLLKLVTRNTDALMIRLLLLERIKIPHARR